MKFLLLILVPLAAQAQLVLFTVDGGTETPVGAAYSLGAIASGATSTAHFRVRNTGITPVVVTPVLNNGQPGTFSLSSVGGANPCSGPNGLVCIDFSVAFLAPSQTLTNNYSAPLQVAAAATSSINVLLTASAVPGPTLTGFPPGCLQSGPTSVAFAAVNIGSLGQCNFSLQNTNSVAIPVSTIQVSGAAFQISPVVTTPLTLAPNNAVTFTIQFQPVCGTVSYAGVLTINSTVYQISGTALTPNLPTPALNFDAANFSSMEQHTLTMTLPSPAVCGATGNVNLAFAPSGNAPGDSTIVFVTRSSRSLAFTVSAGSTKVVIDGQASAVFATGSTAGALSFSVSGTQPALAGLPPAVSFHIAPAPIVIDSATASNQRLGELDVTVIGFDNTYSIGKMSFTFFNAAGQTIGASISADFTSNFQGFFQGQQMGSTFLMRVSFPVTGGQTQVATVEVTLTNSAGQTQTGSLTFQ